MTRTSEAKLFIKDEHAARVMAAVKGYQASRKRGSKASHKKKGYKWGKRVVKQGTFGCI